MWFHIFLYTRFITSYYEHNKWISIDFLATIHIYKWRLDLSLLFSVVSLSPQWSKSTIKFRIYWIYEKQKGINTYVKMCMNRIHSKTLNRMMKTLCVAHQYLLQSVHLIACSLFSLSFPCFQRFRLFPFSCLCAMLYIWPETIANL